MGIVKGFTDIIAPQNLAVNGNFRINQRGLFTDWTPAKVGDFICDAWTIHSSTNVDYFEAINSDYSRVRFRGYGKKGQQILFYNSKSSDLIHVFRQSLNNCVLTSFFTGKNHGGVPLKFYATAPSTSGAENLYQKIERNVKSFEVVTPIEIKLSAVGTSSVSSYGEIHIELQADGEFECEVTNFATIQGAYINPPKNVAVPYSEDLLRCKRFYQSGIIRLGALGVSNGASYMLENQKAFEIEMAETPTLIAEPSYIYEESTTSNEVANYSLSTSALGPKGFQWRVAKAIVGNKPRFVQIPYSASV